MKNLQILRSSKKLLMISSISLVLFFGSCDKVTDLEPFNGIAEETVYENPARCELAVVGVYDAAQSGFYDGGAIRGYPFGAASIQQGDMRGEDMVNVATFYAITYEATYNVTTPNNRFQWETLFSLVNKANVVIEGIQKAGTNGILTEQKVREYEAEARFLRALAYHELLINFARPYNFTAGATHPGVPYRTTPINTPARVDEARSQGRNTVKECYDRILEDLNFAETNLPETRVGALKVSRATQGAAIALKTRVQLHKGDYPAVVTEATKLVGATAPFTSPKGGYTLTASPAGPFLAGANGTNTESIFSIENASTDNPGVNGSLPQMYGTAPARQLIAISPILWNASFWRPNDLRRTLLANNNGRAYFTTKYKDPANSSDYAPIIRYSEVLLNLAEAYAKITPLDPRALALLNAVRNRGVTTVADQYTIASFLSPNALIQAILDERRVEFFAEGRRWPDIHRLSTEPAFTTGGIPGKVLYTATTFASWNANAPYTGSRTGLITTDNFRFLWPIPQSELNTNPVLRAQQNPGY